VSDNALKTARLYRAKLLHSSETCLCSSMNQLSPGTKIVVPSRYGNDLASILGAVCDQCLAHEEVVDIIRIASDKDIATQERNNAREAEALVTCRERVRDFGLDMKLVSAHFLVDESKLLVFFTADERVDFRQLVKDLVARFRLRIELRQIGVRDESRVLGGVAVCGRQYCCHGVTDKLKPVSIKMAKEQNLSLNSMKISGPCGRLLCCLSYEYDFYREEKRSLPSEGSKIRFNNAVYRITEVNLLGRFIRISAPEGWSRELPFCKFQKSTDTGRWEILGIEDEEEE
jgi:cell fate regulator YaaT (PSP1 superfamily)